MSKAIFWDFDGTITYSNSLWSTSVFRVVSRYAEQYGITYEDLRPKLHGRYPWDDWGSDTLLQGDAWWDYMTDIFISLYESYGLNSKTALNLSREVKNLILSPVSYQVYEDAPATLEACAGRGYKNYILSNNYPELKSIIDQLHLSKYFDGYIVSGVVGYNKPNKELFQYALDMANHPDISYMIGDNPVADIEGGSNAGMKTILVHSRKTSHADYTVETLLEIINLLE